MGKEGKGNAEVKFRCHSIWSPNWVPCCLQCFISSTHTHTHTHTPQHLWVCDCCFIIDDGKDKKNLGMWAFVYFGNRNTDIVFLVPLGPVEHVHLRVPFVAIRKKEVNISAVVWPSQLGTLTYFWWFGNSTKVWPLSISICLDSTLSDWYLLRWSHVLTSVWCWEHRGMWAITHTQWSLESMSMNMTYLPTPTSLL